MPGMLDLSAHLPELELAVGDAVVLEGDRGGGLWVLVSGALGVWSGDEVVGAITRPGALVGEVSLLLGTDQWATVRATAASRVRYAADGAALLSGNPDVITEVAIGLAHRLTSVTAYLADLEHQYGDAPGLSMVNKVLSQITVHDPPAVRTGSARDPDPEY
jgi:CRP/FNR family transcriptional regulator, cyclic AMP receptor protein